LREGFGSPFSFDAKDALLTLGRYVQHRLSELFRPVSNNAFDSLTDKMNEQVNEAQGIFPSIKYNAQL
jgi:hypothetical protein